MIRAQRTDRREPKVVTTGVVDLPPSVSFTPGDITEEFSFGVAAAQGPRNSMEDEAVVFPDGKCGFLYAMVLDGHDGLESVQWLTEHMFEIFSEVLDESMFAGACSLEDSDKDSGLCCPVELSPTLKESFHAADKRLLEKLKNSGEQRAQRSGSTATVALVRRNKIIVANVGDSRLVLCRNGRAMDLTTEHRVYGKGPAITAEIERVKSTGGWVDDGRVCGLLAVSRAFGDCELKSEGLDCFLKESVTDGFITEDFASKVHFTSDPLVCTPDVTELELLPDDQFIIIATDGLWDVMSSEDAVRFVSQQFKKGRSAEAITGNLVDLAIKRYTTDNVAAVVIDLRQGSVKNGPLQKGSVSKKR